MQNYINTITEEQAAKELEFIAHEMDILESGENIKKIVREEKE